MLTTFYQNDEIMVKFRKWNIILMLNLVNGMQRFNKGDTAI